MYYFMLFAGRKPQSFFFTIITFIILYNNLIPISLPVTLEVSFDLHFGNIFVNPSTLNDYSLPFIDCKVHSSHFHKLGTLTLDPTVLKFLNNAQVIEPTTNKYLATLWSSVGNIITK